MQSTLLSALAASALLASGAAYACDDMKLTDDGDGYSSKAAQRSAAVERAPAATPVPIDMTTVKKQTAKQKSQGTPLPPGKATIVNTGS
ncbi:MAG: hypothetical protein ABI593_13035 [Betaproteobacteria bacterium]